MDKIQYLDWLYYHIGRQLTDFELQIQNKEGFMSHRRKYSDVGFSKELKWLEYANARTLLKNEVVIDIDPEKDEDSSLFIRRIKNTVHDLLRHNKAHPKLIGVFESNRGVHIHIFDRDLFNMNDEEKRQYRTHYIKRFGGDLAKNS